MSFPFELNAAYNFSTYAPSILSNEIKNAVILGVLDYTTASQFFSPDTKHAAIFPYLPPGTIDDPKKYTYVLFKSESDTREIYALEWIIQTTIVKKTSLTINITITGAQNGDEQIIRDSLILLNFKTFNISLL